MTSLYPEFFRRRDERPDHLSEEGAADTEHFDAAARDALRALHRELLTPRGAVLDLMAGADSHVDRGAYRMVGVGLSRRALADNPALDARVRFDLNGGEPLPFGDARFDGVLCSAGVPYLTDPVATFAEAARVLRPGGVFSVSFSTRAASRKAVLVWRASDDDAHVRLVRHYFAEAGAFAAPAVRRGGAGEPVFTVWARRRGAG